MTLKWITEIEKELDMIITNGSVTVIDGEGRPYKFTKDVGGQYRSTTDISITLLQTNNEYRLMFPGRFTYGFSNDGALKRISDGWNNTVSLTYSTAAVTGQYASNTLLRVEHDNGQTLDFGYASNRLVYATSWVDNTSNLTVRFAYNTNGECVTASRSAFGSSEQWNSYYAYCSFLTQRVNAAGTAVSYQYATNMTQGVTPVGVATVVGTNYFATRFVYEDLDTIVTRARGDTNQILTYQYDPDSSKLLRIVGPCASSGTPGPRLEYAYDDRGNITNALTVGENSSDYYVVQKMYDDWRNVTNEGNGYCSKPSVWRQYGWDTKDQSLTSMTLPGEMAVHFEYTNASLTAVRQMFSSNVTFETNFLNRGVITQTWWVVSSNLSHDVRFYYLTNGLVSSVTNANGHGVSFTYDAYGSLASIIPQLGPVIGMTHDRFGHLTSVNLPGPRTNRMDRNALGWLTRLTYPDDTFEAFLYDGAGHVTNHVDTANRTTRMTWLPMGRLASVTRILEGSPNQDATLRLNYDQQMNSLRITDELNRPVESYVLDIQDRPVTVSNIEGKVMTVSYGVGDFVKSVTRFDGTVVSNQYDSQKRFETTVYPGITNSYGYTLGGLLKMAGSEAGMISNAYDSLQRLIRTAGVGSNAVVNYDYYPAGQVSNVTSVAGTTTYTLDAADRLVGLTDTSGYYEFEYDGTRGLLGAMRYPNGVTLSNRFDVFDRATSLVWRTCGGDTIRDLSYAFSAAGMITNISREDGGWIAYTYDSLDRLTTEKQHLAGGELSSFASWTYDLVGNRTKAVINDETIVYTYAAGNQLTEFGSSTLIQYDLAGNITNLQYSAGRKLGLKWNAAYKLIEAQTNGLLSETYRYDAAGRRVMTVSGGVTNWHVYDGPQVVADLDSTGGVIRAYVWGLGIDNLLAVTVYDVTTNTYFAIKDNLGSVLALTDTNGVIVESYRYDAWGRTTVYNGSGTELAASAVGNRYCWQGREYSWKTGLYYFRARWYDPVIGRWLSNDPIGISGGLNQYVFCANNPVNFVDPSGRYGTDTHFSRTRQWAREAGIANATRIANADEDTDDGDTSPTSPRNFSRTENEHFQQFPGHERRENVYRRAVEAAENGDAEALGRALHEFQDTYAHEGYKPYPGHMGHPEVDIFNPKSERDRTMERRTREILKHWRKPSR